MEYPDNFDIRGGGLCLLLCLLNYKRFPAFANHYGITSGGPAFKTGSGGSSEPPGSLTSGDLHTKGSALLVTSFLPHSYLSNR